MQSIFKKKVADEDVLLMETKKLETSLQRASSEKTEGATVQFSNKSRAKILFPDNLTEHLNGSKEVNIIVSICLVNIVIYQRNINHFADSNINQELMCY